MPSSEHWVIAHREDAAHLLLQVGQVGDCSERYLETASGQIRLHAHYDWEAVVLDSTTRRLVRRDFELFFEREG
jgi:hypothetical protein